jgi:hypothetical protein
VEPLVCVCGYGQTCAAHVCVRTWSITVCVGVVCGGGGFFMAGLTRVRIWWVRGGGGDECTVIAAPPLMARLQPGRTQTRTPVVARGMWPPAPRPGTAQSPTCRRPRQTRGCPAALLARRSEQATPRPLRRRQHDPPPARLGSSPRTAAGAASGRLASAVWGPGCPAPSRPRGLGLHPANARCSAAPAARVCRGPGCPSPRRSRQHCHRHCHWHRGPAKARHHRRTLGPAGRWWPAPAGARHWAGRCTPPAPQQRRRRGQPPPPPAAAPSGPPVAGPHAFPLQSALQGRPPA